MRHLAILVGLILITALISGCGQQTETDAVGQAAQPGVDIEAQTEQAEEEQTEPAGEVEVMEDIDETLIEDEELNVGEII